MLKKGGKLITRSKKTELLEEIRQNWKNSAGIIFSDCQLLPAAAITDLRKECRKAGLIHKVYRNTLISIIAKENGVKDLDKFLEGPTAVTFAPDDAPAAAKLILDQVAKNPKKLFTKAAFTDGQIFDANGVKALSSLPSRPQLLGMLANVLAAPISGLARALNGNILNLAYALNAVKEQKEKAA